MHARLVLSVAVLASTRAAAADESPPAETPETIDCSSPRWVAVHSAVTAWCEGRSPVERPYYDWSLWRTRRRACNDLRASLATCKADVWHAAAWRDDDKPGGFVVLAVYPHAELTFWEVHLVPRGRALRVTSVDFMEDCTGP